MQKLVLIASCIVAVLADTLFVFYAKLKTHHVWLLVAAMILMNISAIVWVYCMRRGIESSIAITFYALFTVAACSAIGVLIFKDHLSTLNLIGMALALVALVLIGV